LLKRKKKNIQRQAHHTKFAGASFEVNNQLIAKERYEVETAGTWYVTTFIHIKHGYCEIQQNCYKRNGVANYGWNENFPISDAHHLQIKKVSLM